MTDVDPTGWIGRSRSTRDTIDAGQMAKIAAALSSPAPALDTTTSLPPGWHWGFFHDITPLADIGRDGHQALGEFLPPVTLPRRMWAAGDLKITRPLAIGETVDKTSTILSVEEKQGRTGKLVFVRVGHEFAGDRGGSMREEHQIVYREAPAPDAAPPKPILPPDEPDSSITLSASPVQLFRYSAVTFNSHRIHYDVDFCRDEEGYDGLIIHGPLTATLLMDLACRQAPGRQLTAFAFRALSPLTHIHKFSLHVRKTGDNAFSVWACNHRGELAMTADAVMSS
ncbi:MAG: MaoC family dehydratase N-terminal domain-containing protein [Pseudomonadota bacterium]